MSYVCGCCSQQLRWITQIFMLMLSLNLLTGEQMLPRLPVICCLRSSLRNYGLRLFTTCFLFPCCHLAAAALLTASILFVFLFFFIHPPCPPNAKFYQFWGFAVFLSHVNLWKWPSRTCNHQCLQWQSTNMQAINFYLWLWSTVVQ